MKHIRFAFEVVGTAFTLVLFSIGAFGGLAVAGHVQFLTRSGLLAIATWIVCLTIGVFVALVYASWFLDTFV
jgi:hypothetical protein